MMKTELARESLKQQREKQEEEEKIWERITGTEKKQVELRIQYVKRKEKEEQRRKEKLHDLRKERTKIKH